jgi:hypothetical protein
MKPEVDAIAAIYREEAVVAEGSADGPMIARVEDR